MGEEFDLSTAASRLAGTTDEAIRFFRRLDLDLNSVANRVEQLKSLSALAREIELNHSISDNHGQQQILLHCHIIIDRILTQLEWVDNGGKHTVTQHGLLGVYEELNRQEIKDDFEALHREQLCLVAFRDSKRVFYLLAAGCWLLTADRFHRFIPLPWAIKPSHHPLEYSHNFKPHESTLLDMLFVTDPREDRASLETTKGRRASGTCTWITETPTYRSWLSATGDARGLVIQGGPGRGKTMMAIYLTEQLERLSECMATDTVIYFFCNHGNINGNSATAVLRGLIWQLCRLRPNLVHHGLERVETVDGSTRIVLATNSTERLWQIFTDMIRDPAAGTITCVLDGLDECDEKSITILTDKFSELLSSNRSNLGNFRILVTSRPSYGYNGNRLSGFSALCLDSDLHNQNMADVKRYTQKHVEKLAEEREWPPELEQRAKEVLDKDNGDILLAALMIQQLGRRPPKLVAGYLDHLPDDPKMVYEKVLLGIPHQRRHRVRYLLSWVTLAYYPLTIEELTLLSDNFTPNTAEDVQAENLKTCIELCGALVTTKTETRKCGPGYESVQTIQLSHQSVKEYLLRTRVDQKPELEFFRMIPDNDHELLAESCLDVLISIMPPLPCGRSEEKHNGLLSYPSRFWFMHLQKCPQQLKRDATACRALDVLANHRFKRPRWLSYLSSLRDVQGDADTTQVGSVDQRNPIYGLEEITDIVCLQSHKNKKSTPRLDALRLASLLGIPCVVHKILDRASLTSYMRQINIRSSFYECCRQRSSVTSSWNKIQQGGTLQLSGEELTAMSPLELAVLGGHEQVVSLLLARHARSSMWPDSTFALMTAVSRCEADIVQLLIQAGTPRLRAPHRLDGPVCTAVVNRRLDVVKFLCGSDVSIWARPESKLGEITQALLCLANTPMLSTSDEAAFVEYARVLVRGGASPDGSDLSIRGVRMGPTTRYLKRAAMDFLFSQGIVLKASGPFPDRKTPLMLCIASANLEDPDSNPLTAIQVLLDSGAYINQKDLRGWSALHHVANRIAIGRVKKSWDSTGDVEELKLYQIAHLLLQAGIDQDMEDNKKRTAADFLRVVGAPIWNQNMSEYERFRRSYRFDSA
ncbi:hypothetical protein F66182_2827 [Fusarium sp. NRRL 66182]|nr:hypothetical protein F66182_2827 [Fusarium sp. NRRL 66182]